MCPFHHCPSFLSYVAHSNFPHNLFYGYCVLKPRNVFVAEVTLGWDEVPNFLISVVFGCLFLGDHIPPISDVWRVSGPQLMYGQILAWGQYAIPALVTGAVLVPALGVTKVCEKAVGRSLRKPARKPSRCRDVPDIPFSSNHRNVNWHMLRSS